MVAFNVLDHRTVSSRWTLNRLVAGYQELN